MSATFALGGKSCHRSACVECRRRKQKCDREWPCESCSRRKVPDRCRYDEQSLPSNDYPKDVTNPDLFVSDSNYLLGKRKLKAEVDELDRDIVPVEDVTDEETTLKAIGYRPSNVINFSTLVRPGPPAGHVATQADVIHAMEMLPPPPHLETLLLSFTETVNYCYYIVDPTRLMEVYSIWREDVRWERPLDPTFVCLMLRVCACAVPYLRPEVQGKIVAGLNMPIQNLADRCHQAATELSDKILIGRAGLLQVQQLLLTSYWHSSEGNFFGCWHALGAAIRNAQEIGLNKESKADGLRELDRDIRRRTWCILDAWDWQIATLFSRPLRINRHDTDIVSPNICLEAAPSPVHHIKLQFEVIQILYHKFGNINKLTNTAVVREFQDIIDNWMESFPPTLRIADPDISIDKSYPWITVHRQYLHVMAYTMMLVPLKSYICRTFDGSEPREEQSTRASALDYCLKLHDAHILLFHSTYPFCAKYHLAQFSLVDLGVSLCFAIMHDEHRNLPKRDQVIGVIGDVLEMLRHTQNAVGKSSLAYKSISKLIGRLPISQDEMKAIRCRTIPIKSDQSPQLATKSAETSRQPIVVPVHGTAAAQGQPEMIIPLDSIVGPPTPVSINARPTSIEPTSPQECFDKALSKFHPELTSRLESANMTLLSMSGSHANIDVVARKHDPSDHYRSTSPIPMSAQPVLEVFLERFVDSYGPKMPAAWQPLHWIHAGQPYQIWRLGAAARYSSTLLCNSFTAVSIAQFGRSIGDWRFVSAADKIYVSVLGSLQAAVSNPERSTSDDVLWAVILCAVYEGVSRTTGNGFLTHLLGILKLLEFRGAKRHVSGIAHGLFVELRCYFVFAAITTRSPTFLAQPDWIHVPWSTGSTPKDLLQHLLDHMVELPALSAYVDQIKCCSGAKRAVEIGRLQQELWTLASQIEQDLYHWKEAWADRYPGGQPRELPAEIKDTLSFFQCQDRMTGEVVFTTTFVYPDPVLAQAMCHYYAALILVFSADTRPRDAELPDIYSLACSISRIMGYFARTVPSGLASRVAFPFRLAYDCLPEGGIERGYIDEAFRWIAKRRFSQEWECTLDGLADKSLLRN